MKETTHLFFDCFWDDVGFQYVELAYCGEKNIETEEYTGPGIYFSELPSCKECEDAYALYMLAELP